MPTLQQALSKLFEELTEVTQVRPSINLDTISARFPLYRNFPWRVNFGMESLPLQTWHEAQGGIKAPDSASICHYTDVRVEYDSFQNQCGLVDLSFRSRLCLVGTDRTQFLHGQVTNDVKGLETGQGCYAALVTAKGKIQSDLNIFNLGQEILLDFEEGYSTKVRERLEKYIISYDVEVVDVAPLYGHFHLLGPLAEKVLNQWDSGWSPLGTEYNIQKLAPSDFGEIYCARVNRFGILGYDFYVPTYHLETVWDQIGTTVRRAGGRIIGVEALNISRIESTIPVYGMDMDETNLAPEAGLDQKAISYTKGCYIGQEVIARIRTYGQVAKALRGLHLAADSPLPARFSKLFWNQKEIGYITSAAKNLTTNANMALGYVRRECNALGTSLELRTETGVAALKVISMPFSKMHFTI